jgi:hypothetical protein
MLAIKNLVFRLIVPLILAVQSAGAADSESSNTNLPSLKVETRMEGGPGLTPAYRVYPTYGSNRYAFLLPGGFRMKGLGAQGLTLVAEDSSCVLTFRVAPAKTWDVPELQPDIYRQAVLSEYPGVKILDEFTLSADNRRGPAFEADWFPSSGLARRIRAVFIPSLDNVLTFSILFDPEKADAGRRALNTVLLTFRANDPAGKLPVAPLSDQL